MDDRTLTLISEPWQVGALTQGGTVVALDTQVEEILRSANIPFISAQEYRTPDLNFRDSAHDWTVALLESGEPLGNYREVSLGRVYFYPVYLYFVRLAYWADILASIFERHPEINKLIV
jgi:hypothetical protein